MKILFLFSVYFLSIILCLLTIQIYDFIILSYILIGLCVIGFIFIIIAVYNIMNRLT